MAQTVNDHIPSGDSDADGHHTQHTAIPRGRYLALLSLSALGIVYGDIGTSPSMPCVKVFMQAMAWR